VLGLPWRGARRKDLHDEWSCEERRDFERFADARSCSDEDKAWRNRRAAPWSSPRRHLERAETFGHGVSGRLDLQ